MPDTHIGLVQDADTSFFRFLIRRALCVGHLPDFFRQYLPRDFEVAAPGSDKLVSACAVGEKVLTSLAPSINDLTSERRLGEFVRQLTHSASQSYEAN